MSDGAEDPRKAGLKAGLRQLTSEQVRRVLDYEGEMVLDSLNYEDGKFCPLAIGLGLDKVIRNPTHDRVYGVLVRLGYKIYNTRGIAGSFYQHPNRLIDLRVAAQEVLAEREPNSQEGGE